MGDVRSKIFQWQIGLAAAVGIILALIWELPDREHGFQYDLFWGMFAGFFWVVVITLIVLIVVAIVWTIMRVSQKAEDEDILDSLSSDIDKFAGNGLVSTISDWIDQVKDAAPIAFAEWTLKALFFWGITGGVIFGLGLDHGGVRLVIVLAAGLVTGVGIGVVYSERVSTYMASLGEGGISWVDRFVEMDKPLWEALDLSDSEIWTMMTIVAWGIGGGFAVGGLSSGGILESIVLAAVAIIGSVLGGLAGIGLKRSTVVVPDEA